MGDCKYCSKPAGFLRKEHEECQQAYEIGKNQISSLSISAALGEKPLDNFFKEVESISDAHFIKFPECRNLIIQAWGSAVEKAFDDGILSEDEETKLSDFLKHFSLSQEEVNQNGAYTKLVQGAVLRDLMDGKLPERLKLEGNLPFNFQKNEKLVWVFQGVKYYEQKVRREYVGGYHGVSIRIAKGLYYRVGAFKGHPVERTEMTFLDSGLLGVTDKHLYFSSTSKSFRIPYNKIVSMTPYSDGIGIQRDAETAKPQTFILGDGWFIYNLLSNITKL